MSTYRIYVDSRERVEGDDTDFTFELPYTIAIKEKSLAMIDVVCVPNSIFDCDRKQKRHDLAQRNTKL